jgi:SAM-dependent methyltransferase
MSYPNIDKSIISDAQAGIGSLKEKDHPSRCCLCNGRSRIAPGGFHLLYPQKDSDPISLEWWECYSCKGWFLHPFPASDIIARYWSGTDWADPDHEIQLAEAKAALVKRLLAELSRWTEPGPLLDFGCNFGQFMRKAQEAGWQPSGFEPNADAAAHARSKGFDVRCGWILEEAGFPNGHFSAITVIDVFCLVSDPIETLSQLHRLLRPGGVLAMRLTNKRLVLGLTRALSSPGAERDRRISKILLPQFHTIGIRPLTRILKGLGFGRIRISPHATTAPWSALSRQTQAAYGVAAVLYYLSLKTINLSPGILLFARKAR